MIPNEGEEDSIINLELSTPPMPPASSLVLTTYLALALSFSYFVCEMLLNIYPYVSKLDRAMTHV